MASPYQIVGSQSSLIDLLRQSDLSKQQSQQKTGMQRGKLQEEFEAELEAAQEKAKKDAKKNKGFFKALNLIGMGLGPLGAALTSGISAGLQGDQQRQAMKKLLSGVQGDRWKKTFLRDPMKTYKQEAEDTQMSSGDVLRGAFGSGLTSFMTSKMLGGDKETGGLFKKMGEAKKMATKFQGQAGAKFLEGALKTKGLSPLIMQSKNPAIKQLLESFKGFSKGEGLKGGTEEMQSAMMWPMLLQQLIGE